MRLNNATTLVTKPLPIGGPTLDLLNALTDGSINTGSVPLWGSPGANALYGATSFAYCNPMSSMDPKASAVFISIIIIHRIAIVLVVMEPPHVCSDSRRK